MMTTMLFTAQAGPPGGGLQSFLPLLLILAVFYFLLIRPQQRRAKEHEQLLESLKRGDKVTTAGGLYGTIVEVREHEVKVEIADKVQVRIEKAKVASRLGDKEA